MSAFEVQHPRAASGQFTEKQNTAPAAPLPVEPAPTVIGYLRLQQWGSRDELVELSTKRLDVRAALDTYPLSRVRTFGASGGAECVVEQLRELGVIAHDGPVDLHIYAVELDDYIAEREAAGSFEPVTAEIIRPLADVEDQLRQLDAEYAALQHKFESAQRQYLASLLAPIAPQVVNLTVRGPDIVMFDAAHTRVEVAEGQLREILIACERVRIRGSYRLGGTAGSSSAN